MPACLSDLVSVRHQGHLAEKMFYLFLCTDKCLNDHIDLESDPCRSPKRTEISSAALCSMYDSGPDADNCYHSAFFISDFKALLYPDERDFK